MLTLMAREIQIRLGWFTKFQIRLVKKFFKFTFNVDPDGQGNIIFADRTEQGREMNEPVDPVRHDDFLKILEIQDVGKDERA